MKLKGVDRTILVQSSNIDLGDVLPDYARISLLQLAGKYFGRLNTANVHFTREGVTYRCTVNVQMGALRMMSGEAKRERREDKAERLDKHPDWLGSARRPTAATSSGWLWGGR